MRRHYTAASLFLLPLVAVSSEAVAQQDSFTNPIDVRVTIDQAFLRNQFIAANGDTTYEIAVYYDASLKSRFGRTLETVNVRDRPAKAGVYTNQSFAALGKWHDEGGVAPNVSYDRSDSIRYTIVGQPLARIETCVEFIEETPATSTGGRPRCAEAQVMLQVTWPDGGGDTGGGDTGGGDTGGGDTGGGDTGGGDTGGGDTGGGDTGGGDTGGGDTGGGDTGGGDTGGGDTGGGDTGGGDTGGGDTGGGDTGGGDTGGGDTGGGDTGGGDTGGGDTGGGDTGGGDTGGGDTGGGDTGGGDTGGGDTGGGDTGGGDTGGGDTGGGDTGGGDTGGGDTGGGDTGGGDTGGGDTGGGDTGGGDTGGGDTGGGDTGGGGQLPQDTTGTSSLEDPITPAELEFFLAPNPTRGQTTLRTEMPVTELEIFSLAGRRVGSTPGQRLRVIRFDAPAQAGLYLVVAHFEDGRLAQRKLLVR